MVNVGSFDAKTHLTALLERVIRGETVQITRRGVPVAKLVPVDTQKRADAKQAAATPPSRSAKKRGGFRKRCAFTRHSEPAP